MRKLSLLLVALLFACKKEATTQQTAAPPPPDAIRNVVDSIFPVAEEIRRFKAARNGASASELENASSSRDALVERFIEAVETRDTMDIRVMAMNAAEFIDLYYPTSIYSHPPYKQSPELFWFLLQENSEKGIKRLLDRAGGRPLHLQGYRCQEEPLMQAGNRFWSECKVRWQPPAGIPNPMKIFGVIMERNGRFKFVSYSNDF